jgi:leucyl aminopeptidase
MLKVQVSVGDPLALERDALVVAVAEDEERFKGVAAKVDRKLNGQLKKLREWKEVKGKLGEVTVVHTLGLMQPRRIALVGLGKRKELDAEKVRRSIGSAVKALNKIGCEHIAVALDDFSGEGNCAGGFGTSRCGSSHSRQLPISPKKCRG